MGLGKSLKIGILFDDSLDRPDGVQQYIMRVAEEMTRRGHEVHFLVGETKRTDLPNLHSLVTNMAVSFNGNSMTMPRSIDPKLLKAFLAEHHFDVVHVQAPYSPFFAGKFISELPGNTAVVGTFHILPYSLPVKWANRGLALLNKPTAKRINKMMSVSPPAKDFAKEIYDIDSVVVPNPIDVSDFMIEESAENDMPHIVFLGRLVPRKGARQLLEAVKKIVDDNLFAEAFRVTIAGKGDQLDELQAFSKAVGGRVVFNFPGFIDEADKPSLLQSGDIVALPSISGESFGISVVEALASSRGAVLAGNNPGYASVLHGLTDCLVDPLDTDSFAKKIANLLADRSLRSILSERQKMYAEQFDIEIVGDKIEDIYRQAVRSLPTD